MDVDMSFGAPSSRGGFPIKPVGNRGRCLERNPPPNLSQNQGNICQVQKTHRDGEQSDQIQSPIFIFLSKQCCLALFF
jgi:hypothetical protein